ncbi:MAG TPA: methyltransferase, partial [Phytomonospora sp.]
VRLLRRCAEAVAPGGKVLVVDHFEVTGDSEGDLRMLCYFRGRERGLERLAELAAVAGLSVETVRPGGSRSIVELRR